MKKFQNFSLLVIGLSWIYIYIYIFVIIVKASLHSFAYNLFTDFDFTHDLEAFFKAPPGVSLRRLLAGILTYDDLLYRPSKP